MLLSSQFPKLAAEHSVVYAQRLMDWHVPVAVSHWRLKHVASVGVPQSLVEFTMHLPALGLVGFESHL